MTEKSGLRVGVLGATGSVGGEILSILEERAFPARRVRAFASAESVGLKIEFCGESLSVEPVRPESLAECDLLYSAAPGVLDAHREALREQAVWVVDVSGALELDLDVPLCVPGVEAPGGGPEAGRWIALPRGSVAGLAAALAPLASGIGLERVTAFCLESASGVGRQGIEELADQTLEALNAMTGEDAPSGVFPRSLAFDCLPLIGQASAAGESSEERRLIEVLRRVLGRPKLRIEATRVRVPVFSGSLVVVHSRLAEPLGAGQPRELWEKQPHLELLGPMELPTPRSATGRDGVQIGRVRVSPEDRRALSFVLALDDLRFGSALAAVLVAEARCRVH